MLGYLLFPSPLSLPPLSRLWLTGMVLRWVQLPYVTHFGLNQTGSVKTHGRDGCHPHPTSAQALHKNTTHEPTTRTN